MEDKPAFQHPQQQSQSAPAYGQVYSDTLNTADAQTQTDALTQRVVNIESKRVNFNTDIIGVIETMSIAPTTTTPTSLYQQLKIYTGKLYFYDSKNKVWDIAGGSSLYSGAVTSGGTAGTPFPSGWTVSVGSGGSVGIYTITHNLGTTAYTVVATATGAFSYGNIPGVTNISSNSFQITMGTVSGGSVVPTDNPFDFILSM